MQNNANHGIIRLREVLYSMLVSVIIPTCDSLIPPRENEKRFNILLKPCIDSLVAYTSMQFVEVIVVANGCEKETIDYVNSLGNNFKVIEFPEPMGYPKSVNAGLRAANGEYIVLLNNDVVFLPQEKDTWLKMLIEPMVKDKKIGITGPMVQISPETKKEFVLFFLAMIRRDLLATVGYLDEQFTPGAGEDTDYCVRAIKRGYDITQAPSPLPFDLVPGLLPVYHSPDSTVIHVPEWKDTFKRNGEILISKYGKLQEEQQRELGNDFERPVIGRYDAIGGPERLRMVWMRKIMMEHGWKKIYDFGCSTGFAAKFIQDIPDLEYTGFDYDSRVTGFATKNFGHIGKFIPMKITREFVECLETPEIVIAFEFLEHLEDGRQLAQSLKEKVKCVLATAPYNEPPGFWGPHHKLHRLFPEDFPGFKVEYLRMNECVIGDTPAEHNQPTLMLLSWIREEPKEEEKKDA